MKQRILLFAVLTCGISTTFAGGEQSRQTTSEIKIAKMSVLEQRLADAQKNDPNFIIDKNILKLFAGESFICDGHILMKFDYIETVIVVHHGKKFLKDRSKLDRALIDKDRETQKQMVLDAIKESNDNTTRDQDKIKTMQPLILELILKTDHPALYAQLKEAGKA